MVNKPPKPYLGYGEEEVRTAVKAVQDLSNAGRTAVQTAIRYVLHQPAVTATVVGMRTVEQLEEAVATLNTPELTQEEIDRLKRTLPANCYTEHR